MRGKYMKKIIAPLLALSLAVGSTAAEPRHRAEHRQEDAQGQSLQPAEHKSKNPTPLEDRTAVRPALFWNKDMVHYPSELPSLHPVLVAVLDSGVDCTMPALQGKCLQGYDFWNGDADPQDDNGHGTSIASLIAGRKQENGFEGLCPNCIILPVKVLDHRGLGDAEKLTRAIYYAADNGADIINMSMGFDPSYDPEGISEAVQYALERNIVVIASAGNENKNIGSPARERGVLTVGAVTADGRRAPYSNYSLRPPFIDITAPGGDDRDRDGDGIPEAILTLRPAKHHARQHEPTQDLWLYSGTSHAAAQVSSLAGVLQGMGADPEDVPVIMMHTAQDTAAPGPDEETGMGIIDFTAAMEAAKNRAVERLDRVSLEDTSVLRAASGGRAPGRAYEGVVAAPLSQYVRIRMQLQQ